MSLDLPDFQLRHVDTRQPVSVGSPTASPSLHVHVATAGTGTPVLLLHGWPFTWYLWRHVMAGLVAAGHRVIAPDLRGMGATDRPEAGYDLDTLAGDAVALLDALDVPRAHVVGFDLGTPIAFWLGLRHPERVERLAVMEGALGRLPGAERFFANGAPWWFGFHGAVGLAETVLEGHEGEYLDHFFRAPTGHRIEGVPRDVFVRAHTGKDALRGGFAHYRAMPENAARIAAVTRTERLRVPTLAIAGGVVGDALARQLAPLTDHLQTATIADCGHVIPEERPTELLAQLVPFFCA